MTHRSIHRPPGPSFRWGDTGADDIVDSSGASIGARAVRAVPGPRGQRGYSPPPAAPSSNIPVLLAHRSLPGLRWPSRLNTLSSVQLPLRSVMTTLTSCCAKPNAVEADLPRHMPSRRMSGEALTETNHTPALRLSSRGHRRAGSVTDRPLPDARLTAHITDSPSRPRPQLRAPYYRSTRSRSETPSINQLLRARTPLVSKPSTPYPHPRGRTEARHETRRLRAQTETSRHLWGRQ